MKNEKYNPSICCICDSTEYYTVVKGPVVKIVSCKNCGLMRQGVFKKSDNYSFTSYAGSKERFKQQRRDKERVQIRDFLKIVDQLEKYMPQKGSLLEIGCAMGTNLNELRKAGWDVTGVEPGDWTCEKARKKYGLNVINATFQKAGLKKESYDVIIMFHVIEHLLDPYEGLQYLTELLKPGGILVLETPRYDTITFKVLKGRERSVIPEHFYYFTRKSLRMMAQKTGTEEINLESVGRTLTLDRLSFYAAKLLDTKFTTKIIASTSDLLHLNKICVHINLHDMMRVYLRKS